MHGVDLVNVRWLSVPMQHDISLKQMGESDAEIPTTCELRQIEEAGRLLVATSHEDRSDLLELQLERFEHLDGFVEVDAVEPDPALAHSGVEMTHEMDRSAVLVIALDAIFSGGHFPLSSRKV